MKTWARKDGLVFRVVIHGVEHIVSISSLNVESGKFVSGVCLLSSWKAPWRQGSRSLQSLSIALIHFIFSLIKLFLWIERQLSVMVGKFYLSVGYPLYLARLLVSSGNLKSWNSCAALANSQLVCLLPVAWDLFFIIRHSLYAQLFVLVLHCWFSGFYGSLVLVVLWFRGSLALAVLMVLSCGSLVFWLSGSVVFWLPHSLVFWFFSFSLALWFSASRGFLVLWLLCMIIFIS